MRLVNLCSTQRPHRATRMFMLYEAEGSAFATSHPVRFEAGRWRVGPGRPLSRDAVSEVNRKLAGQSQGRRIPPAHVLYADSSRVLWHRPRRRAPVFFHTGKAEFDGALRNQQALFPALLFLAFPGNLYVWALASDERPEEATRLYQTPCLNIYDSGHLCAGTTKLPLEVTCDVAPFERAFYETTFTHSNYRDRLTNHPGGHDGLWRDLADPELQVFPVEWLRPLCLKQGTQPFTVGHVLNMEAHR